jgi:hypothetical protein
MYGTLSQIRINPRFKWSKWSEYLILSHLSQVMHSLLTTWKLSTFSNLPVDNFIHKLSTTVWITSVDRLWITLCCTAPCYVIQCTDAALHHAVPTRLSTDRGDGGGARPITMYCFSHTHPHTDHDFQVVINSVAVVHKDHYATHPCNHKVIHR